MQAPCGASADESLYFGDGRQPASDASDLDALDRELAALDRQRAAVVRRALHAALALTEDAALGLAAARIFACPTPPQAMGGNARPGYAIAGPNLGSYALAVLAAEWAGVGLAGEDLHVQGRALALPAGPSGGCCDVEEETLEEEAGAAPAGGAGAGQGLLAQEEEGERSEEDRDVWDTAAAAAAASLYCASGGGGGGGSPSRRSLWGWETPSSGSGTQRSASCASSPPQSSTPALASALASFSSGSGAGSCTGGGGPSAATSQRGSPTAPPGRPHGLPGSGPTSRRTSAVLIPPPSFLAPAGLGLPMLRAQHASPQASCTPSSGGSGKGSGASTARGGAGGSSTRPLSPGQLQVIGTRLWVGAGPPTREELATSQKGASRGKQ